MMTPKNLAYICEWAKSGNEPRPALYSDTQIDTWDELFDAGVLDTDHDCLNSAGLTIAKLSEENAALKAALEQACETAEMPGPNYRSEFKPHRDALETMRKNRRRLLG